MKTRCAQCTKIQKDKALDVITRLYYGHPELYLSLAVRYDPSGEYTKNFESWFDGQNAVKPLQDNFSSRIPSTWVTSTTISTTTTQQPAPTRPVLRTSPATVRTFENVQPVTFRIPVTARTELPTFRTTTRRLEPLSTFRTVPNTLAPLPPVPVTFEIFRTMPPAIRTTRRPDLLPTAPAIVNFVPVTFLAPPLAAQIPVTAFRPEPSTQRPVPAFRPEPATQRPVPAFRPEPSTQRPAPAFMPEPSTQRPVPAFRPEPATQRPAPSVTQKLEPKFPPLVVRLPPATNSPPLRDSTVIFQLPSIVRNQQESFRPVSLTFVRTLS